MFDLSVEGCREELRVVRLHGHEAISSLFEFRVEVASEELSVSALIGQPARLTLEGPEGARHVVGFVCQAEYIGDSRRYALHELTIVPWIWRLQQRAGCRIFQQLSTPEILVAVLSAAGLRKSAFRLDLHASYAPRDYCTQYGETDLDFIHRLMESDGITYYHEHDREAAVLVLSDRGDCLPPPAGEVELRWAPPQGIVHAGEHVTRLRLGELMRPERVSLGDMNLHSPDTPLAVSEGSGDEREIYEYPGGYQQAGKGGPERGGQQARLRLEALQATRRRGFGTSDSPRLVAGNAFKLAGHPRAGVDGEYRLVSVTHRGEQPQALDEDAAGEFHYSNDFECMASELPYRAPRVTPRPTMRGLQTATVVGPAGEEVHVDEHGRVKIQFHWDREGARDERSSCWVRVGQMWAGDGFGALFLPRVGHEVLVDFIEGDPDRPLITGRIYTGFNRPPYPLPDEKTKSTIKSDTSPGGGGANELRFEDARGNEELYLHAQRDLTIAVEHDKRQTIGRDESLTVAHDRVKLVEHDEREEIKHDRSIKVGNAHSEDIGADMQLTVGANLSATVRGGQSVSVRENLTESAGQNIVLQAGKHFTVTTGENVNISSGKSTRVVVGDKLMIACGAATVTIQSSGAVTIQTGGAVTIKGSSIKLN